MLSLAALSRTQRGLRGAAVSAWSSVRYSSSSSTEEPRLTQYTSPDLCAYKSVVRARRPAAALNAACAHDSYIAIKLRCRLLFFMVPCVGHFMMTAMVPPTQVGPRDVFVNQELNLGTINWVSGGGPPWDHIARAGLPTRSPL